MKVSVNQDLLPMKAHYFFFNAGTAPVVPFMPTFARQLGFSDVIIGIIYTVLPIVGMLAKPLFGFLADRYQRHRILFLISEVITGIAFFSIMFIPPMPLNTNFHCLDGVSDLKFATKTTTQFENKLMQQIENKTVACELNCLTEEFMRNIVCEYWLKSSADCRDSMSGPRFKFNVLLNANNTTIEKENFFFLIHHNRATMFGRNITLYCPSNTQYFNANCNIDCNDKSIYKELTSTSAISNHEVIGLYQFWLFFGFMILSWIGMAVVVSIGDAICFSILGERHHLYGQQRLYGSLGWGIFSIIAGVLVDQMSADSINKDYTIVFWMTAIIIGIDVLASTKLKHTQTHLSPNILRHIGKMFRSIRCVIFFMWCVAIGMCTALVWNFLFLYLEDLGKQNQKSMKTLQGFVMGIQCFGGELPFFFLSGWIIKKIGHVNAMSLVLFSFGIRFLLYSILENPWYVLPIELLNGCTFGLFYATMASYASFIAPTGTEATMQGLVGAIFEGVGVSIGSFCGGMLFSSIGGNHTFEIYGTMAFILFVAHVCVQWYLKRKFPESKDFNGTIKYLAPNDAMHIMNDQEYSITL